MSVAAAPWLLMQLSRAAIHAAKMNSYAANNAAMKQPVTIKNFQAAIRAVTTKSSMQCRCCNNKASCAAFIAAMTVASAVEQRRRGDRYY